MTGQGEGASHAQSAEPTGSTNGMGHKSFREGSVTQGSSLTASLQNSDDEYEESQHSESTWLSRAQHRTEELRKLFHLPTGEVRSSIIIPNTHRGVQHLTSIFN